MDDERQRETQTLNTRGNQDKEERPGEHGWQQSSRKTGGLNTTHTGQETIKVKQEVGGTHRTHARLRQTGHEREQTK